MTYVLPNPLYAGQPENVADLTANLDYIIAALNSVASAASAGGFTPGDVIFSARASIPAGWLACEGQSLSTTDDAYEALFAAIAYTYGGAGATFNVPDLRGRFPLSKGTNAIVNTLGYSEGDAHASRTPLHGHGITGVGDHTHTGPAHTHDTTYPVVRAQHGGHYDLYLLGPNGSDAVLQRFGSDIQGPVTDSPGAVNQVQAHSTELITGQELSMNIAIEQYKEVTSSAGTGATSGSGTHDHGGATGQADVPYLVLQGLIKL